MKMKHLTFIALLGFALAGCSTLRPSESYVSKEITASDALTLASDASVHLSETLPPAKTTLVLDTPTDTKQADVVTPVMIEQLRKTGFGVVQMPKNREPNAKPLKGVAVRYLVSPFNAGVLMRLSYRGQTAARFYPRDSNGTLVQASPFTISHNGAGGEE